MIEHSPTNPSLVDILGERKGIVANVADRAAEIQEAYLQKNNLSAAVAKEAMDCATRNPQMVAGPNMTPEVAAHIVDKSNGPNANEIEGGDKAVIAEAFNRVIDDQHENEVEVPNSLRVQPEDILSPKELAVEATARRPLETSLPSQIERTTAAHRGLTRLVQQIMQRCVQLAKENQ